MRYPYPDSIGVDLIVFESVYFLFLFQIFHILTTFLIIKSVTSAAGEYMHGLHRVIQFGSQFMQGDSVGFPGYLVYFNRMSLHAR